ncbi:testis-specific serine/threonine-protein kinase 1-like [Brevipalpus obovatus]|uniref:testis-specific serine/threonine-protein kinase 1-like n=1 Tax=Brevipalpus obovatus TaxID=246614 RepID=UPI003D9E63E8
MPIVTKGMRKFQKRLKLAEDKKRLEEVLKLKERMQANLEALIKEERVRCFKTYIDMFQVYGSIDYDKSNLIGRGGFTKTYKTKNPGGETVAAKVIDMDKSRQEYREKFLPRQLNILVFLNEHRNEFVLQTFGIAQVRHHIFIYSEYCELGSLVHYQTANKLQHFPKDRIQRWALQLINAIEFLHYYCIAHRNLTPDNIFVKDQDTIRVSGFGFSRFCYDAESGTFRKSSSKREDSPFLAPEIIESETVDPKLGDIWSWGSLVYWLTTGEPVYNPKNMRKKDQKLKSFTYKMVNSERVSRFGSTLLDRLLANVLVSDASKRIPLEAIKNNAWIQESMKAFPDGANILTPPDAHSPPAMDASETPDISAGQSPPESPGTPEQQQQQEPQPDAPPA